MAGTGGKPPPEEGGRQEEFLRNLFQNLPSMTASVRQEHFRVLEEERKKKELEIGFVGKLIGDVDPRIRIRFALLSHDCAFAHCFSSALENDSSG